MQQTATQEMEAKGLVYWGYLQSKDVMDSKGRFVGVLRGIVIDNNWTIPKVVIEVNGDILDELGIERHLFETALVALPSEYAKNATDVVQLTGDVDSLKGKAELYIV